MAKRNRFYVVWQGRQQGIYESWDECKAQVTGLQGAKYKAFDSRAEAEQAIRMPYESYVSHASPTHAGGAKPSVLTVDANGIVLLREGVENGPELDALAVDAACAGNPGVMEYQGVYIRTNKRLFHYRAECGTNNIGEFLAIVHGLSYLKRHRYEQLLYTDSRTALSWVRQGVCKSKLPYNERTAELWDYVHRAEQWLRNNTYNTEIRKWDTDHWGEIPADFGRK